MWAGVAVAMISLSTAGQSLNKGAMRMLCTRTSGFPTKFCGLGVRSYFACLHSGT
jgi:hypothetical protein